MDVDELKRLFDYSRWANLRFLDAADGLTAVELNREIDSSFPGVLATLVHMLGAEWVWLERWRGTSPTAFPDASDLVSAAAVRARWDALWSDQQAFLATLGDADARRSVPFRLFNGGADAQPLGDLMRHVVNHGSYHRGQVATMLRQLGKTPPSTDYIRYLREGIAR
jgi:uncharacterized damage-inducible protein DinB